MEASSNLSDRITSFIRQHWLELSLASVGLIFFVYGLIALLGTSSQPDKIKFETSSTDSSSQTKNFSQNLIAVDVEGEVVNPGVYKIKENSLVQDALISSGGFTALADRNFVAKNINLAQKLIDGQKIYIPKQGEQASVSNASTQVLGSTNAQGSSMININFASEKDLDSLPGIGPVTAQKIINNRPYATINQLLDKKSVSQKVFDQIKDKIIAQ